MKRSDAQHIKEDAIAKIARAFTNPVRQRMLALLAQGDFAVDTLARKTGQSRANASAQLKVLLDANLVTVRREGKFAYYALAGPPVVRLLAALSEVAALQDPAFRELARTWMGASDPPTAKQARALERAVSRGEVALIDVRPADEYAAGHLPGARSIPSAELSERLAELPRDQPVVIYCRGPWCMFAVDAAARLRDEGYEVRNLFAGVPEWAALGLGVERD